MITFAGERNKLEFGVDYTLIALDVLKKADGHTDSTEALISGLLLVSGWGFSMEEHGKALQMLQEKLATGQLALNQNINLSRMIEFVKKDKERAKRFFTDIMIMITIDGEVLDGEQRLMNNFTGNLNLTDLEVNECMTQGVATGVALMNFCKSYASKRDVY